MLPKESEHIMLAFQRCQALFPKNFKKMMKTIKPHHVRLKVLALEMVYMTKNHLNHFYKPLIFIKLRQFTISCYAHQFNTVSFPRMRETMLMKACHPNRRRSFQRQHESRYFARFYSES
ncbi:MAG: hypothetical protein DRR19_13185 [Candidatus Parabeggiatoa sp. nov. 1]|nr:MAG: hypothetical protein DRR19_13185 [Gammaproteobacteria bacterium]